MFIYPMFIFLPGVADGTTIGLNLQTPLYLGGVDPDVRVVSHLGMSRGFHGCISEVSVVGIFIKRIIDSKVRETNNVKSFKVYVFTSTCIHYKILLPSFSAVLDVKCRVLQ